MTHPDHEWAQALPHRPPNELPQAIARFERVGLTPATVRENLLDLGDALTDAFTCTVNLADLEPFGGPAGAALIAAEVQKYTEYAQRRAAVIRSDAFNALLVLQDMSYADAADVLSITRQAVHKAAKKPSIFTTLVNPLSR